MRKSFEDAPKGDIEALMRWCNDEFFSGELPDCPVTWNDNFTKKYGLYRSFGEVSQNEHSPAIDISSVLKGNHKKLVETMAHELIHHWQMHKYHETGNAGYLDKKRDRRLDRSIDGHSTYFQSKMNEINALGYGINIDIRSDLMETLKTQNKEDKKGFVVNFENKGKSYNVLYVFQKVTDTLGDEGIARLKETYGELAIKDIFEIETNNQNICAGIPCLKNGNVRKSTQLNYNDDAFINEILDDENTVSYKSAEFTISVPIDNVDLKVQELGPYFKRNAGIDLKKMLGHSLSLSDINLTSEEIDDALLGNINKKKVSPETVAFIKDKWDNALPGDIYKHKHFKGTVKSIYFSLSRGKESLAKDDIVELMQEIGYSRCKETINEKLRDEIGKLAADKGKNLSDVLERVLKQVNETEVALNIIKSPYFNDGEIYKKSILSDIDINGITITPTLSHLIEQQVTHFNAIKTGSVDQSYDM